MKLIRSKEHQIERAQNMNYENKEEIISHFETAEKYEKYDELFLTENFSELLNGNLSDESKEAIVGKYNSDQKKTLKPAVIQRYRDQNENPTICAYCGKTLDTNVLQLDHVLPKEKFKDLAIYKRNLVLACGPCNGSFNDNYVNSSNQVKYHKFLHTIERIPIYEMEIIDDKVNVRYVGLDIATDDNVDIEKLKGLTCVTDLFLTSMGETIDEIQLYYDENGDDGLSEWYNNNKAKLRLRRTNEHMKGLITAVATYINI